MRDHELAEPRRPSRLINGGTTHGVAKVFEHPQPDPAWLPETTRLWESYWSSGQASFSQASDAAILFRACQLSDAAQRQFERTGKWPAMLEESVQKMLSRLLFTERDRRDARIELDAPQIDQGHPAWFLDAVANGEVQ